MDGKLKSFKGADFIELTSSTDKVELLHKQLELCITDIPRASSPDQLSDQRVVCDRALRACNQLAGSKSCHGVHLEKVVALAELVCWGFCASSLQRTPFYLEKILFHLMKNVCANESSFVASTQVSSLLYSILSGCPTDQQSAGDFAAVAKSSFQVLWKAAGDQEQKKSSSSSNRETLCLRLHALRFLILLPESVSHGDSLISVSRHTKYAILSFQPKGKTCSKDDACFLSQSLEDLLVKPLLQRGAVTGPWARYLVELTLERCHKLCQSGCFQQGQDVLENTQACLKKAEKCCYAGLALVTFGVDVYKSGSSPKIWKQLVEVTDTIDSARTTGDGWLCQALSECCQFAVSCLDAHKHTVNSGKPDVDKLLSLAKLHEKHFYLLEEQVTTVPKDSTRQLRVLKQQQFSGLQQFTNAVCTFLQNCKDPTHSALPLVLGSCKDAISRMLVSFHSLPDKDATEFLNITASCVQNMAYWFYNQKKYQEASDLVSPLCELLSDAGPGGDPNLGVERLHRCFRLHVESCRKAGQIKRGLSAVALWLRALRSQVAHQMAEPIALWVRLKMDGAKNGDEDLRLHTLKDGLEGYSMDPEVMVSVLAEELKGYKSVHGDTGQERYNTICDLLELCSEEGDLQHLRAPFLLELAQVMCYHDYTGQTDCTALDAVQDALRLLDSTSRHPENIDRLQDIKAQALLWQYICTLEANMQEGLEEQKRKAKLDGQNQWKGVDYEPNDLNYEDKLIDDQSVRDGICFTLAGEAGPMKGLDEALDLWKGLLSGPRVPSLNSSEQTIFSLHLLGSLYRLMGKPLHSIQSFQLASRLCHSLGDHIREVAAFCQLIRVLFYLQTPQHALDTLQNADEALKRADTSSESYMLMELYCKLLHSHLCRVTQKIEEGVELLLGLLQHPSLQKSSKAWYLLKVQVLQELSLFLRLPSTSLCPDLYRRLCAHGFHNPETALTEAHRLLRSIVLLLLGNDVLSSPKGSPDVRFVDNGENLLQKWQVLADLLSCTQDLVGTLCRMGNVSEAKSFCLEGLRVAKSLQSMRHCADFLVRKAELESLRSEMQLCEEDLQYVVFLMESCTDFTAKAQHKEVKIKLRKGKQSNKAKPAETPPSPPKEDFLKAKDFKYINTRDVLKEPDSPTSAPCHEKSPPRFLSHALDCTCPLCSDLVLSLLCTQWLVTKAENDPQSRGLLRVALKRCQSIPQHFSVNLCNVLGKENSKSAALGVADELTARVYLGLASLIHSANLPEGTLNDGLSFLSLRPPSFPVHWRAGLLFAKALNSIYKLAAKHGGCIADIFMQVWGWQPQREVKKVPDLNPKNKALVTLGNRKAASRKTSLDLRDPFSQEDSGTELLPVPTRPQTTPMQKDRAPTQARPALSSLAKSIVTVYNEESPMPEVLPKAPRRRTTRPVLKVDFSDSDLEVTDIPETAPVLKCKKQTVSSRPRVRGRGTVRSQLTQVHPDSDEEVTVMSKPRKGRPSTKKTLKETSPSRLEKRHQLSKMDSAPKEVEVLRSIEEEPEWILDVSIEALRASDTEEQKPLRAGRKTQKASKKDGAGTECEVLRRDAGGERLSWSTDMKDGETDPNAFSLAELSSSLPAAFCASDLGSVSSLLQEALKLVAHFPPCILYSRLCRLLALCSGGHDPYTTALLVNESVSITLRHQLLSDIHRKLRKLRRESSGDVCDKLQSLTLESHKDPRVQHLCNLEELFQFPIQALDSHRFQEQLQHIPTGTAVCILTLADSQSRMPGDTLLFTRIEYGSSPVTVQIPTSHMKVTIRSILQEFDDIQKQQKIVNNLTDKKEWWEGRMGMDSRMKALIHTLEEQVLGCWKVLLMPPCSLSVPAVAEESSKLSRALSECGWRRTDPALFKAMLGGSHFLTPLLIQSFVRGFRLSQPEQAQRLLQEAVERLKTSTEHKEGHLVLILDKHLQKLPWESMPCLQNQSVSRLPSLQFLLSYSLLRRYRPQTTLVKGVDPKNTFYVLNPHANLPGTEERFRDWFKNEPGWNGVIRSAPKSEQLQSALTKQDLYIYVGHGAGAHFLDVQTLQRLDCNAVALLFGCSSAALAVRGDLEGSGIVLKYLMAGCPLVLGNLWDVTDREIDRYTKEFLQSWLNANPGAPLLKYMSDSRQAPKLKYIIGAAPVAYGLPVTLR
ncbi:LOW QUALITY PROTEIN: separin [Rhinophrynus dorsalis]